MDTSQSGKEQSESDITHDNSEIDSSMHITVTDISNIDSKSIYSQSDNTNSIKSSDEANYSADEESNNNDIIVDCESEYQDEKYDDSISNESKSKFSNDENESKYSYDDDNESIISSNVSEIKIDVDDVESLQPLVNLKFNKTGSNILIRGYPLATYRLITPMLDVLPEGVIVLDEESPLIPESAITEEEAENQKQWFSTYKYWVCMSMAVLNVGLFILFTPSLFKYGFDGFGWILMFVMLPWMIIKFICALYFTLSRKRINKFSSFESIKEKGAAAQYDSELMKKINDPYLTIFVPVWREKDEQLRRTLLSIRQGFYQKEKISVVVVIDECAPGVAKNVLSIMFGIERAEWMSLPENRVFKWFSFSGVKRPYYVIDGLTEEGIHCTVFMKRENRRKWDSIVLFFMLMRYLSKRSHLYPNYIMCVDSDTQLVESETHQSMREMVTRFELFNRMMAACGETCVANIDTGFVTKSQVWEYFSSFNYDKAFESAFGRVLCLPGCMTMFRGSVISSDEFYNLVLKKFAARPDSNSLISHICKEKGEDRWLTLLLIEMANQLKPRGTIEYIPEASCTTNVPATNDGFISQRYRWTSSTYCCIVKSPIDSFGYGVGIAWIIDFFNSCFYLAFILHFYYVVLVEIVPSLFGWSSAQAAGTNEVIVVCMNVVMQCIIAWLTHRENALGYAWAYIARQYIFGYCIWIPIGTLWTLNNINTWEGAREQIEATKAKGIKMQSKEDDFFAPAYEQLEDFDLESKRKLYKQLSTEFLNIQQNNFEASILPKILSQPDHSNSRSSLSSAPNGITFSDNQSSDMSIYSSATNYNKAYSQNRQKYSSEVPNIPNRRNTNEFMYPTQMPMQMPYYAPHNPSIQMSSAMQMYYDHQNIQMQNSTIQNSQMQNTMQIPHHPYMFMYPPNMMQMQQQQQMQHPQMQQQPNITELQTSNLSPPTVTHMVLSTHSFGPVDDDFGGNTPMLNMRTVRSSAKNTPNRIATRTPNRPLSIKNTPKTTPNPKSSQKLELSDNIYSKYNKESKTPKSSLSDELRNRSVY